MKFEYVASGPGFFKLANSDVLNHKDNLEVIRSLFSYLNGRNGHNFSILFNGWTEDLIGGVLFNNYKDVLHNIQADSGGLQIITQGAQIDAPTKDRVYRTQANYADVGMCFDEIPLKILGESSKRGDTSSRFFDEENLEYYARETGKNVKRQIEVFLDQKTSCKPMLILQGNCYDSFMKWTDYALREIPSSYQEYLKGLSISAACHGDGMMEDIERAILIPNLPHNNHIHLLGAGSVRRLLPYVIFVQNGYYSDDAYISYDSTSLASCTAMGRYFIGDGQFNFTRQMSEEYEWIYNSTNEKFNLKQHDIDVNLFHKIINSNISYFNKDEVIDEHKMKLYFLVYTGAIVSAIGNFTECIHKCMTDKNYLTEAAKRYKMLHEVEHLLNIRNYDDFVYWKKHAASTVKSRKISQHNFNTLESFF